MAHDESHSVSRLTGILSLAFIAAFVCFVLVFVNHIELVGGPSDNLITMDEDLSRGWATTDGRPVNLGSLDDLPEVYEGGATIARSLPDSIQPGAELNFLSKNCILQVSYDGQPVYEFDPDQRVYGMPYEEYFNYVPLQEEDAGKEVSIRLVAGYPDVTVRITDVRVSGTASYIQRYLRNHALSFLISLVIVFLGAAVLALYVSMRGRDLEGIDLRSLSAIAILLGTWSATETLVPQLVTGVRPLWQALDSASLLFVPCPMFCFACSLVRPKRKRLFRLVSFGIAATAFAIVMIGSLAFGLDLHQLLVVSHVHLVLQCLLFACAMVVVLRGGKQAGRSFAQNANKWILASFFVMIALALLDFVLYVATQGNEADPARFARLGLFVFTSVITVEAFRTSIDYVRRADRVEEIETIAYTDALTGIPNRTAWQLMEQKISEALATGITEDALVCQFDVNLLKQVNDTMGHAAGDEFIRRAANTIKRSYGTEGTCYRTGGDEFTALLLGVSLDERASRCHELLVAFEAEQDTSAGELPPLSIACGTARVSECGQGGMQAALELADKRMYEDKRALKGLA